MPVCTSLNHHSNFSCHSIGPDRKKVLKHHPDKKAGAVGDSNDDAFFKCIQKANDILTHQEKRRQFDSVDPYYDLLEADVPTAQQVTKAKDPNSAFFRLFSPVFGREARFSRQQPVPQLGEYADSKESVEAFYHFWYNFDSWRSFEYLDKEVNEGSDKYVALLLSRDPGLLTFIFSRDDKRYTEKKNKAERARRKKEDTARLRNIVDVALSADPRIKRIKQEEKDAREAKRKNKAGTGGGLSKAQVEEEKRRAEEEAKAKEEAEKVCLCAPFTMSFRTDGSCRLRRQRRRRRRPRLLMLRRRRAVPREPRVALLKLRNDGSGQRVAEQSEQCLIFCCLYHPRALSVIYSSATLSHSISSSRVKESSIFSFHVLLCVLALWTSGTHAMSVIVEPLQPTRKQTLNYLILVPVVVAE